MKRPSSGTRARPSRSRSRSAWITTWPPAAALPSLEIEPPDVRITAPPRCAKNRHRRRRCWSSRPGSPRRRRGGPQRSGPRQPCRRRSSTRSTAAAGDGDPIRAKRDRAAVGRGRGTRAGERLRRRSRQELLGVHPDPGADRLPSAGVLGKRGGLGHFDGAGVQHDPAAAIAAASTARRRAARSRRPALPRRRRRPERDRAGRSVPASTIRPAGDTRRPPLDRKIATDQRQGLALRHRRARCARRRLPPARRRGSRRLRGRRSRELLAAGSLALNVAPSAKRSSSALETWKSPARRAWRWGRTARPAGLTK